jgi:hypothetical protein
LEVTKPWSDYDTNKYYIITRDKETNEWKFFKEIVGHTVLWKDEPSSRYGMTKSRAIKVLNIVKNLTNEDVEPETPTEEEGTTTPTDEEPTTPTEPETPTNPTEGNEPTTPTTDPTDTPTEPSESDNGTPTNTDGETPTGENEDGETASTGDTEAENGNGTNTEPTDPTTPVEEPTTPVEPEPTETQYKIITISSVTYNSTEVAIFDDDDYNKLKSTLIYIDTTYPNNNVNVVTVETDTGKSIFYFYLEDELTWFLELRTNIDYSLVSHVTKLDDIRGELL